MKSGATTKHLKGLREFRTDNTKVKALVLVTLEGTPERTDDGIDILPYEEFLDRLWADVW